MSFTLMKLFAFRDRVRFEASRSDGSVGLTEYARNRQGVPLTLDQLDQFLNELTTSSQNS